MIRAKALLRQSSNRQSQLCDLLPPYRNRQAGVLQNLERDCDWFFVRAVEEAALTVLLKKSLGLLGLASEALGAGRGEWDNRRIVAHVRSLLVVTLGTNLAPAINSPVLAPCYDLQSDSESAGRSDLLSPPQQLHSAEKPLENAFKNAFMLTGRLLALLGM